MQLQILKSTMAQKQLLLKCSQECIVSPFNGNCPCILKKNVAKNIAG